VKLEGKPPTKSEVRQTEHLFASTTWEWKKVRMRRPAGGHSDSAAKPLRWRFRSPWDKRRPLTLTVTFRGGAEAWVEVHARGSAGRFPGHVALIDVLEEVWNAH